MADPVLGGSIGVVPDLSSGPGSKTPTPINGTAGIGGGPSVKPKGEAGAPMLGGGDMGGGLGGPPPVPKTPEELEEDKLALSSVPTIIEDISEGLDNELHRQANTQIPREVEKLVNHLLELGWTEGTLKKIIRKSKMKPTDFFVKLAQKIKKSGEAGAIEFLKKKLTPEPEPLAAGTPPMLGGAQGNEPAPVPQMEGVPQTAKASSTNVHSTNQKIKRGDPMGKIVIKEGALVEVSDKTSSVLNDLVVSIRKTRASISRYEEAKLRYAGIVSLRKTAAFGEEEGSEEDTMEDDAEFGGEETDDFGAEDTDMDKEKVLDAVAAIKDAVQGLEDAINGVEAELGGAPEEMGMDIAEMNDTEGALDKANDIKAKAHQILKSAKKDIAAIFEKGKKDKKKDKKDDKKKGKSSKDPMAVAMGGKTAEDKHEDNETEEEEEKEESCKDKDASETDSIIKRVKARLSELRRMKESQLYPFENIAGPSQNVSNINAENAGQQASTADSEIKGQPAKDKDNERINSELGQKDLAYKTEGKSTKGKDVAPAVTSKMSSDESITVEAAETARTHSIKNAVDKAKLSVELASQQQLKGLIASPLKEAFMKNMTEVGIPVDTAEAIIHNAFVDGYEANQKVLMKEAFETFMAKPIEDFVKVAQFTKSHVVKEGSVVDSEEESRDKSASVGLKGSPVADTKKDEYRSYWEDKERNRRGF